MFSRYVNACISVNACVCVHACVCVYVCVRVRACWAPQACKWGCCFCLFVFIFSVLNAWKLKNISVSQRLR